MSGIIIDSSVTLSWLLPDESFAVSILDRVVVEGALVSSLFPLIGLPKTVDAFTASRL